jgi:hypothetical protein
LESYAHFDALVVSGIASPPDCQSTTFHSLQSRPVEAALDQDPTFHRFLGGCFALLAVRALSGFLKVLDDALVALDARVALQASGGLIHFPLLGDGDGYGS